MSVRKKILHGFVMKVFVFQEKYSERWSHSEENCIILCWEEAQRNVGHCRAGESRQLPCTREAFLYQRFHWTQIRTHFTIVFCYCLSDCLIWVSIAASTVARMKVADRPGDISILTHIFQSDNRTVAAGWWPVTWISSPVSIFNFTNSTKRRAISGDGKKSVDKKEKCCTRRRRGPSGRVEGLHR